MQEKNLCSAVIGGVYQVREMLLPRATKMRLTALGLTAGTQVRVLNNKHSGSVIFCVRGTRLAVGKKIAEHICISGIK
jgi:ferrous iron transport protein A